MQEVEEELKLSLSWKRRRVGEVVFEACFELGQYTESLDLVVLIDMVAYIPSSERFG